MCAGRGEVSELFELEIRAVDYDPALAAVGVVDLVHLVDVVKPPDHVRRADRLARLDGPPVILLNERDVAPLVAPRLGNGGGVERHPGEPRPGAAVALHLDRA